MNVVKLKRCLYERRGRGDSPPLLDLIYQVKQRCFRGGLCQALIRQRTEQNVVTNTFEYDRKSFKKYCMRLFFFANKGVGNNGSNDSRHDL